MINDIEHLFMALLAFYISFVLKESVYLKFLYIFKIQFYVLCISVERIFYIFWILNSCQYMICIYFLPLCGLFFHFLDIVLWYTEVFNFYEVQFIYFSLCCLCFWCHIQETIAKYEFIKFYPTFCKVLALTFRCDSIWVNFYKWCKNPTSFFTCGSPVGEQLTFTLSFTYQFLKQVMGTTGLYNILYLLS